MNGFSLITFLFFVLVTVFGASAAITNTNTTNAVFETHSATHLTINFFNVFSSAAAGNDIVPRPVEGYDIVHRPVVVEAFSHHPLLFVMKGVARSTRPGPFEGNYAFFSNFFYSMKRNVEPARPGPLNVNDMFVIFCNEINNNIKEKKSHIMNSLATLEQDVAPGLARRFATQVEVETEVATSRRTSSSVKQHLQALGAFLHSALPSGPALPSWATTTITTTTASLPFSLASSRPSWPAWSLTEGANVVPRWVAIFAAQLVGLLYAAYLWTMKDSLPAPPTPAPARYHHGPIAAAMVPIAAPAPAPAHRRFVTARLRRSNTAGQPPAAPAFQFQAPMVVPVPQPPAGAAAVFQFQAPVPVPVPQPPAAPAVFRFQAPVAVPQPPAVRDWAAERDAGIRAQMALEAWLEEVLYTPEPEMPEGMDMCIWISMRRLQEERSLAEASYDLHRFLWGNSTNNNTNNTN